jgi:hypothetical protein
MNVYTVNGLGHKATPTKHEKQRKLKYEMILCTNNEKTVFITTVIYQL